MPLQNHPFVQRQQGKFHNATSKYEMRHFIFCCESFPTSVNMHVTLGIYECIKCKRDKHQSPQFSPQNDMIPLTLSSVTVQELINFTDATQVEFMLVAISCPIMRIVCYTSGATIYSSHAVKFLQDFGVFLFRIHFQMSMQPQMGFTRSPLPRIMVIYPYPFLVVITQLFSWIIFINYCICILTGSPG